MSKRPTNPPLYFLLRTATKDKTVRFTAQLVTVNEEGSPRNLRGDYRGDPGFGLADLVVSAQANLDDGADGDFYAAQVRYEDVYFLELDRAVAIAAVLRRVNRVFEAEGEDIKWGRSLETTLRLAAKALKVKGFLLDLGSNGTGQWGYDGIKYGTIDLNAAVDWAGRQLAAARR